LEDKKAEDITVINVTGKSSICDFLIIATGNSTRQVAALAETIRTDLKVHNIYVGVEGLDQCDWALVDAGDVVIHVFRPEIRSFYNLEKMWTFSEPEEIQKILP
jgi:ribosome-associated protein